MNPRQNPAVVEEGDEDTERAVAVERYVGGLSTRGADRVAHEEPLEIQLNGVAVAVVMRTPGHDEELALGFLLGERVIERASDVVSLRHATAANRPEAEGNLLSVVLSASVAPPLERLRRNTYASSSCGVCGKATIEAALLELTPVTSELVTTPRAVSAMATELRRAQPTFELTGGLHAAGLFTEKGELVLAREDVGRHNAVDKVIGAAARSGVGAAEHALFVSGRVSLEIVQKAAAAGIGLVLAVSAPTSLAVRYAEALGITLVGFVRGDRFNVYAGEQRVVRT